ncbi:MAG TPA: hypothetical protein VLB31_00075, partial [Actinomycetota bacterium]|nr:hypothetical protein [Actinomycetota bacterium]
MSWIDGMPPRSRNQRTPTGPDTPHAIAASSLDSPSAIFTQNLRSISRRTDGRPGDHIAGRPVSVVIHPGRLPIQHLRREVLRPPVESTRRTTPWKKAHAASSPASVKADVSCPENTEVRCPL